MIQLTISLAALALSIFAWILARRQNRKLVAKIKEQKKMIDRYVKADNDISPTYFVATTKDEHIGVCRYSTVDGYIHKTCIKLFTDPDQDFNCRQAEELVEKLREK